MFLHHSMTDAEILRTCEGCESPHLRLVSDRLRDRVQDLRVIEHIAEGLSGSKSLIEWQDGIAEIIQTAQNGK